MSTKGKTWTVYGRKGSSSSHESKTRLYRIWIDMKSRCLNPNCKNYKYYGLRGITICDEWVNNYQSFKEWAINAGYNGKLTIDRINNNGNYEPGNCRWETKTIQNMNKSYKSTSGYVGITKSSNSDCWYGRVKVNGNNCYTGSSTNIHEAAKMRNEYIISHNLPNRKNVIREEVVV